MSMMTFVERYHFLHVRSHGRSPWQNVSRRLFHSVSLIFLSVICSRTTHETLFCHSAGSFFADSKERKALPATLGPCGAQSLMETKSASPNITSWRGRVMAQFAQCAVVTRAVGVRRTVAYRCFDIGNSGPGDGVPNVEQLQKRPIENEGGGGRREG